MDWKYVQQGIFKVIENKKKQQKVILRISKKHLTILGHIMWKMWRVIIVHNLRGHGERRLVVVLQKNQSAVATPSEKAKLVTTFF